MENHRKYQICFIYIFIATNIWSVNVLAQCGGSVNNLTVVFNEYRDFSTPSYPSSYQNYQICEWRLDSGHQDRRVAISFMSFNLETSYDYLYIYDGSSTQARLLVRATGSLNDRFYISSGQFLFLRFTSDYSITWSGFKIQFIIILETISLPSCGSIITLNTTSGEEQFTLSTFPESLDNTFSSLCDWTINALTNQQFEIKIVYTDINNYESYGCDTSNQYGLSIYEGTIRYQICSLLPDTTVTFQGSGNQDTKVTFRAPFINNIDRGFIITLKYTGISAPVGTTFIPTTPRVSRACGSQSSPTVLTATGNLQYVRSPNFPSHYTNLMDCWWIIGATDTNTGIWLYPYQVQTDVADTVTIYDGPSSSYITLQTYSGTYSTNTFSLKASGSSITIHFYSDGSNTDTGFSFGYVQNITVIPSCVPSVYTHISANETGIITSHAGYGTDNYINDLDTYWLIDKGSQTSSLYARLDSFKLESSTGCIYDYLKVYNGACEIEANRLYFLCGQQESSNYEQHNGRYILLHFHTDGSITNEGWQITYSPYPLTSPTSGTSTDEEDGLTTGEIIGYIILCLVILFTVVSVSVLLISCCLRSSKTVPKSRIEKPPTKMTIPHSVIIKPTARKDRPDYIKGKNQSIKSKFLEKDLNIESKYPPISAPLNLNYPPPSAPVASNYPPPSAPMAQNYPPPSAPVASNYPPPPVPLSHMHPSYQGNYQSVQFNPMNIPSPYKYEMPPQLR